jgi:hypothetical protein
MVEFFPGRRHLGHPLQLEQVLGLLRLLGLLFHFCRSYFYFYFNDKI